MSRSGAARWTFAREALGSEVLKTWSGIVSRSSRPENGPIIGTVPRVGKGRQLAMASSVALGGLPVLVQLLDRKVLEIPSLRLRLLLHDPKASLEAAGRGAKGVLGVHAELAGDIDQGEQQITKLRLAGLDGGRLA